MTAFFDTNIIVCGFDRSAGPRHDRALALIEQHARASALVVSTQVLQESYAVLTGRMRVPPTVAQAGLSKLARERVVTATGPFALDAMAFSHNQQLSIWDALIITAALDAGCGVVFTEALQAGRRFGELEVVDPFAPGAREPSPSWSVRRPRRPVASRSQRL